MKMVLLIWALQSGVLVYLALRDADLAAFLWRLRETFFSPAVWMLGAGCIGFLYAGMSASAHMDVAGSTLAGVSFLLEFSMLIGVILRLLFARRRGRGRDLIFGSATFATPKHAAEYGLIGQTGIRLGTLRCAVTPDGTALPLHYTGDKHLLTVAPTRAGKGVSTIIPNLLTYPGSCIVIDPKGENAVITAAQRSRIGSVRVIDPWGITGIPAARFNPLSLLHSDSTTLIEDATLIAEALVLHETGGNAQHFSEQASDLVKGFLLNLVLTPGETPTLGRLRAILTSDERELTRILLTMSKARHPILKTAAAQSASKNDKEWLSIVSTAQRNTHFLDSPALQASLAASDFRFADLKGDTPVSIYLVLPVDRLSSHNRWLRMIVALAVAELARTPKKPRRPVLFLLDEFTHLGRMPIIEDAYGLMAGMGLQMHAIVQDLASLHRVYGEGWQTFVGNTGAIQVFGTRDLMTANYFSALLGTTTATVVSTSTNQGSSSGGSGGGSTSSGSSISYAPTGRPLLYPDELMRMDRDAQIVFVENANPCLSDKIVWHKDPAYVALAKAR